jgi:hypothetical protein
VKIRVLALFEIFFCSDCEGRKVYVILSRSLLTFCADNNGLPVESHEELFMKRVYYAMITYLSPISKLQRQATRSKGMSIGVEITKMTTRRMTTMIQATIEIDQRIIYVQRQGVNTLSVPLSSCGDLGIELSQDSQGIWRKP